MIQRNQSKENIRNVEEQRQEIRESRKRERELVPLSLAESPEALERFRVSGAGEGAVKKNMKP